MRAGPRAAAAGGDALGFTTCEARSAAGSWSLPVVRRTRAHARTHTHARTRTHARMHARARAHTHAQASFKDAHKHRQDGLHMQGGPVVGRVLPGWWVACYPRRRYRCGGSMSPGVWLCTLIRLVG